MFTLGAAWGTCIDVSGDHTAIVSAAMNTAGQVASLTCPLIVAYTLKDFDNNWNITIWLMSLLFFAGVGCWFLINPNKPIFAKESARVPAAPQP
jgi:ACS family glucarate transporter-like MFS transporter